MQSLPPHLIPLNVASYGQEFRKLQGWFTFSLLALASAALLVVYELLLLNVQDADFRDMLLDYRLTQPGARYQHTQWAHGHACCHSDPAVLRYSCDASGAEWAASFEHVFRHGPPHCPPAVRFTCPILASAGCSNLRAALYPAAGLTARGQPANCSRAGKVLLQAASGPGYSLRVWHAGQPTPLQLTLPFDTSRIDTRAVRDLITAAIDAYSDPLYWLPSSPLGRAVRVDGAQVLLAPRMQAGGDDKWGTFGWPGDLWPWPPAAPCSRTGTPPQMRLEGGFTAKFRQYSSSSSSSPAAVPAFNVTVLGSHSSLVPQYQLQEVPAAAMAAAGGASSNSSQQAADGLVAIKVLTHVRLVLGQVAPLGEACEAWQLVRVEPAYAAELWRGKAERLAGLAAPLTAGSQAVGVSLHDAAEPLPLALPRYAGQASVYAALALGAVWVVASVPLLGLAGLVWINVQRNRGLPLFVYRYMRRYRGW